VRYFHRQAWRRALTEDAVMHLEEYTGSRSSTATGWRSRPRARFVGDRPLVGLATGGPDLAGREVIVLVDDGPWWFRLRGASFRGVARRDSEAEGVVWWAVAPRRVLAWDYGMIREA
jgi:hypothetical protein